MELSSTEFAWETGAGASIQYYPNDTLTAPEPAVAVSTDDPGSAKQQVAGGFLKKGVCYVDPICGIVSKKPVINEHGYRQICFWSCWLPALSKDKPESGATITIDDDGKLIWDAGDGDATDFATYFTVMYNDKGTTSPFVDYTEAIEYDSADKDLVYYVRIAPTNSGAVPQEAKIEATINSAEYKICDDPVAKLSMSMQDQQTVKVAVEKGSAATATITFTYGVAADAKVSTTVTLQPAEDESSSSGT